MDPARPHAGCVYSGTLIYSVSGVDKTRTTDAAFKIHSMYKEHDSLENILIGSVLVHTSGHNGPWQAGRVHADGIHWEKRVWVKGEFNAFRDHVASLVEVRLSPREELEQMIANGPILIRNYRRLQARYDHGSDKYTDFEGMIAATLEFVADRQRELEALTSSSPDMASAAR